MQGAEPVRIAAMGAMDAVVRLLSTHAGRPGCGVLRAQGNRRLACYFGPVVAVRYAAM